MKNSKKFQNLNNELFKPLSIQESKRLVGASSNKLTKKWTRKVTAAAQSPTIDALVDYEIDF